MFTKEQNTKIHFKKYPNPIKPYKSHFKCFLIAKITSSERGRKKQINKSVNNGRETCTRRAERKNTEEEISDGEKKAGFMCSKDGKKMPIFNNYFQIDLTLEKTEDHIIRNLELKTKGTKDFPEFSR